MKKFLFIALLGLAFTATETVQAQDPTAKMYMMLSDSNKTSDTVAKNTTKTLTKELKKEKGRYVNLTAQVIVTKISDTVNGTVYLKRSNYNGSFVRHNGVIVDSFVLTNVASQSHIFNIGDQDCGWYQLEMVGGSNTMQAKIQGILNYWDPLPYTK